ncbi:short transient receptor potential channel 4-associated protein isoform X2 [Nematostella vectensis]|uniref:short transient receptor potential channel 4-associated protein isoform X2 n=1 Tax=Nematostella vectensis TaxID=45351 RepID=UPI00138FD8B0|nr:short transient receptor potential channel 4-associated protein isoform X2 [Nematostella vectensis]
MAVRNRSCDKNLASQIMQSRVSGSSMRVFQLPDAFVEETDRRLRLDGVPSLLRKIQRQIRSGDRLNVPRCTKLLEELCESLNQEGIPPGPECNFPSMKLENEKFKAGKIVNLFGGVEMLISLLFHPANSSTKSRGRTVNVAPVQVDLLRATCLEILHNLCLTVDGIAAALAKKNELITHLFTFLQQQRTFMNAASVLEDILAAKKELIDLESIGNLKQLISTLEYGRLANFCRVLSFTLTDMEAVEDRSTLLAQDEQERKGQDQKELADSNQESLIRIPEFLARLVKLACRSLSDAPVWPSMFGNGRDGLMEWLGFHAFLEDMLEIDEHAMPSLSRSLKLMHEVMYKVEVFYVLCLFLTGKHKQTVQSKLSELRLIPGMCELFDNIIWQHTNANRGLMEIEGDHECTPETALKIQFLRLVHSFCDRHENKHLLLSPREVDELIDIYRQNDREVPSNLLAINKKRCCTGEKGLLSKILEVLVKTPATAALRFWLSRAIEGFLRGRSSIGDQLFLIKRGLLEHLVEHITSPELKPKEILQSSFDLLGELMKFNEVAFKIFNSVVTDKQFEKFLSILTSNVVDSNMLIRCLILSQEHFLESPFGGVPTEACRLSALINDWEQRMYLLYKLINSITVTTLTQENVSCLNTTLVFLMFAYKQGHLPMYLSAFVREEKLHKNPGFIMKNLRRLLEFWKTHYLRRGKDCSALEQSSCISFDRWKKVVDVLLQDDMACTSSVNHYLTASLPSTPQTRDC